MPDSKRHTKLTANNAAYTAAISTNQITNITSIIFTPTIHTTGNSTLETCMGNFPRECPEKPREIPQVRE